MSEVCVPPVLSFPIRRKESRCLKMLNKISPVDYSVFALSLLVPALVALYYAFVQRQKTTDAYFLGNRKMGAVPLAFSLAASYLSATTITGE